jgi:DNA-directed RNA polymerase subunit RPC12/RpoP
MCINNNPSVGNKPLLRGRLKGNQLRKLAGLLDMLYTPVELAMEIGFTRRQVYRAYLPLGCPNERDEAKHVFINGHAFREWYTKTYRKLELAENEAYCLSCKKVVLIIIAEKMQKGNYRYWSANCPNCGGKISKAISNRRLHDQ